MGDADDHGLDREDIQAEKVTDLTRDGLIRLFTMRLATYHKRHDRSKERCVGEVAKEFRDDYKVNILRILDEVDYHHPDGYVWNIPRVPDDTLQRYDPVLPESMEEGGTADFRPGDVLEIDGDGLLIIGVDDSKLVGMNKSGKIGVHALATVRHLFASSEYSPTLIRDGEVVRGVSNA